MCLIVNCPPGVPLLRCVIVGTAHCLLRYVGALKSSQPDNGKNKFIISKLFLFLNIISRNTNTFIPAMIQRHYPVPVVVLRKICKIPLYSCIRLLIRRKTLTNEEEFEFWEEIEVRGRQNWGIGWMFQKFIVADPLIFPLPKHFCGRVHCPDKR